MAKTAILKDLIDKLGLSINAFERAIDVGQGAIVKAIKRDADLSQLTIEKILRKFPNVSKEWLLTAEGDIFEKRITGDDIRQKKAFGNTPDTDESGLVYVPISAQAGYAKSFNDPLFINTMERLYIPGLPYKGDEYRYFDVEGDSMHPTIEDGMQVIGQKIEPEYWSKTKNFYIHVVVLDSMILIKRIFRKDDAHLVLISDNDTYPQQLINIEEIKEIWLVKRVLSWKMPPPRHYNIEV